MLNRKKVVIAAVALVAVVALVGGALWAARQVLASNWRQGPLQAAGTIHAGPHTVQFYSMRDDEVTFVGFFVDDLPGGRRYFPCAIVDPQPGTGPQVFLSDAGDEMWVCEAGNGHHVWAYYRIGSDQCVTEDGDKPGITTPLPRTFGGNFHEIPAMDPNRAKLVLTLTY
jgi:hypothetical protein